MSVDQVLRDEAIRFGASLGAAKAALQREINGKNAEAKDLERRIEQIGNAPERATTFPVGDGKYRCPQCWVERGQEVLLQARTSDLPDEDLFVCKDCGYRCHADMA